MSETTLSGGAPPLGAILAGGRNRRYGEVKALATIAGDTILARLRRTLAAVVPDLVLIANDRAPFASEDLPVLGDRLPDLGPAAGIHAALCRAHDEGRAGVVVVACDMPFVPPELLRHLLAIWRPDRVDAVLPESGGPRGIEPLCGIYGTACIPAIEAAAAAGDRRVIGFHSAVRVQRVPREVVARFGKVEDLFFNVNTPEDRLLAEAIAGARP